MASACDLLEVQGVSAMRAMSVRARVSVSAATCLRPSSSRILGTRAAPALSSAFAWAPADEAVVGASRASISRSDPRTWTPA